MTSVDTPKSAQKNTTDSIEHNTDKKESLNASADSIHSTTKSAVSTPPSKSEIKNQLQDSSLEKQQQEINQQDQPKLRRSSRRNNRSDQDPIIAPGFGTAKDIARLSAQLSEDSGIILPPEAIVAMMNSRGEGITSSRRSRSNQAADDEENDTAPVPGSSAWADFMKEEATDNKKSKSDDETSQQDAAAKSERKRTYDIQEDTKKKSKPEPAVADEEDEDLFEQHCGVLVQTGTMDSTIVGRNKVKIENPPGYNLMEPTKILPDVIVRTVHTSSNSCHSIAISQKYDVYGWGRNEVSQLAGNLPDEVVLPTILDLPKHAKVISAATGKSHTLFLYDDGSVYAIGFNKVGQCGVKANLDNITTYRKCVFQSGGDVVDVQIKQVCKITKL